MVSYKIEQSRAEWDEIGRSTDYLGEKGNGFVIRVEREWRETLVCHPQ